MTEHIDLTHPFVEEPPGAAAEGRARAWRSIRSAPVPGPWASSASRLYALGFRTTRWSGFMR